MKKYAQAKPWMDIIKTIGYPDSTEEIYSAIEENGNITLEDFKVESESFFQLYLSLLSFIGGKGISKLTPMFNTVVRILDLIGHEPEKASEEEQLSLLDILAGDEEIDFEKAASLDEVNTKYATKFVGGITPIDPSVSSLEDITKQMGLIAKRMLLVSPEERDQLQDQLDELDVYRSKILQTEKQPQKPKSKPKSIWNTSQNLTGLGGGKGWNEETPHWKPEGITTLPPRKDTKPVTPAWLKDPDEEEPKWYEQQRQIITKVPEGKKTVSSSWTDFHDINFLKSIMKERGWWISDEFDDVTYAEALIDIFDYPELTRTPEYFIEKYEFLEEEIADLIQVVKEYYPELFYKKIASKQILEGGKGDNLNIEELPKKELELGLEVESEHSPNKEIQEEIVSDHEAETIEATGEPSYYEDYLIPMENLMKKNISLKDFANIESLLKYAEEENKESEEEKKDSYEKSHKYQEKYPKGNLIDKKASR